jgi:hypothetical protein
MIDVVNIDKNTVLVVTVPPNNLPKHKYYEYIGKIKDGIQSVFDIPVLVVPNELGLTFVQVEEEE